MPLFAAPMVPSLCTAMAAPRRLGEPLGDFRARRAALEDITADLIAEYLAGGGDEWFETSEEDPLAA